MDRFFPWLRFTWRRLTVLPVLLFLANRDLRRGRPTRARTRLERCAVLVPFSFRAHFGLARAYISERDFARARRELMLARQISPARFEAQRNRLPAIVAAGDGPPTFGPRPALPGPRPALFGDDLEDTPFHMPLGDCTSRREWERFERMGPIRSDESWGVDWERVVEELCRDDQPGS